MVVTCLVNPSTLIKSRYSSVDTASEKATSHSLQNSHHDDPSTLTSTTTTSVQQQRRELINALAKELDDEVNEGDDDEQYEASS